LSLPVGGTVGKHIDMGSYYQTKDRYHLSIQGRYKYMVGDEEVIVEPGTLLWFNNKLMHGTENVGDCTRITFVFDVPHSKWNP
jgi:mannose-6-phosphate isomerase-like protein (cupin superfamily)